MRYSTPLAFTGSNITRLTSEIKTGNKTKNGEIWANFCKICTDF